MKPSTSLSVPRLLLGLTVTVIASLSVHAFMLQVLHIPFPASFPRRGWPIVPDRALSVLAAIYLSRLLPATIRRRSLLARCLILFFLLSTMQEIFFRAPFMEFINLSGFTLYPFLDNVPKLLPILFIAMCVEVWSTRPHRAVANILAAVGIGVVAAVVIAPAAHHLFEGVLAFTQAREGEQRFGLPYGWQILVPAYLTFLEPALAALWIGHAIWPQLPRLSAFRVLLTAALIVALKGPVFAPFLNIFYAGLPPGMAMLSYAQFGFETVTLGLLTAATLLWSLRMDTPSADPS